MSSTADDAGTHTDAQLETKPLGGSPSVGAEVGGSVDLSQPLTAATAAAISDALERHKVLVFRGQDRMGADGQLRLIQALNRCWELEARSEQQQYTYENGAFVIKMLAHKKGHANVWRVESGSAKQADGGSAPAPSPADPAALATAATTLRAEQPWPFTDRLRRANPEPVGSGRFFHSFGGSGSWSRPGHEATSATNVWHSDDNYVLEPPWATTLRAVQLPAIGGDTVFADMGQAYDSLSPDSQALLCGLEIETDWMQSFPHYSAAGGGEQLDELCR